MRVFKFFKKLKRDITILIVPHSGRSPVKIKFTFAFLLSVFLFWTFFTLWAGYISSRHFDYWKNKLDSQLTRLKFIFLAHNMKKYKELVAEVQTTNEELCRILGLKTKKNIIESDGRGGPSEEDSLYIEKYLENKIHELDKAQLSRQIQLLEAETFKTIENSQRTLKIVNTLRKLYRAVPNMPPAVGKIVSAFGYRIHPIFNFPHLHTGIDIAGSFNSAIRATADGKVIFTGWEHGYGRLVILQHDFGYRTYYAHLNKIIVKEKENVKRGEIVGLMGNTGTSTGVHLHYEVRKDGKYLNPLRFLTPDYFYEKEVKEYVRQER